MRPLMVLIDDTVGVSRHSTPAVSFHTRRYHLRKSSVVSATVFRSAQSQHHHKQECVGPEFFFCVRACVFTKWASDIKSSLMDPPLVIIHKIDVRIQGEQRNEALVEEKEKVGEGGHIQNNNTGKPKPNSNSTPKSPVCTKDVPHYPYVLSSSPVPHSSPRSCTKIPCA